MQYIGFVADGTGSITVPTTQAGDILVGFVQKSAGSDPTMGGTLGATSGSVDTNSPGSETWKFTCTGDHAGDTVTAGGSARRLLLLHFRPEVGETVTAVTEIAHAYEAGSTTVTEAAGVVTTQGDALVFMTGASSDVTLTTEDADLTVVYAPDDYGAGNRGIFGGYDIMDVGETSSPQYQNEADAAENWMRYVWHIVTTYPAGGGGGVSHKGVAIGGQELRSGI